MPLHSGRGLVGLAILAFAFAPGAEAVVCGADQYLEMDGAWTTTVNNAPQCTTCPDNMKNPAGVAGGYGDSAAPRYASAVAAAVAATTANNNILTWCNVPEGYYLSDETSAVLPGVCTACPTGKATTGVAQTITGAVGDQTAAVQCLMKSTCLADQYLEMDGLKNGATPNAPKCTDCPTNMVAPATPVLTNAAALVAHGGVADGAANNDLITSCNVPEGYYLSTATSATSPGAVTACSLGDAQGATTGVEQILPVGVNAAQFWYTKCIQKSTCIADQYLHNGGNYVYQSTPLGSLPNTAKAVLTSAVTLSTGSIKLAAHGFRVGQQLTYLQDTYGTLMAPLTHEQVVYVLTVTDVDNFIISTTKAGTAVTFTDAGHNTQKLAPGNGIVLAASVTLSTASILLEGHGFVVDQQLLYTDPATDPIEELAALSGGADGDVVYVLSVTDADNFIIKLTKAGTTAPDLSANVGTGGNDAQTFTPVVDKIVLEASVTESAAGTILLEGHGFVEGQELKYTAGSTLIAPLTDGQIIYVKTVTDANNFIISATFGGDAITITNNGEDTQMFTAYFRNKATCKACPTGMTAPAGGLITSSLVTTAIVGATAVDHELLSYCNVPAGSYLSAAVTSATGASSPGAATSCSDDYRFLSTTSTERLINAGLALTSPTIDDVSECTKISLCAANEYLESDGSQENDQSPFAAIPNKLVCTACPAGMSSLAGPLQGIISDLGATAVNDGASNNNLITICHVPDSFWLSTVDSATSPGAVTACGDSYAPSKGTTLVLSTPENLQTEIGACTVPSTKGATGTVGTAGTASPAAPLSVSTAAVFGAVLPMMLILV